MTKLLELKDVTVKFGGLTAASAVNITIDEGDICAVIGPNGAGKTTVFNCVTGVYTPTSGTIYARGKDIREPFRPQTLVRGVMAGALFGSVLVLGVNAPTLWEASIYQLYVYQQPFDWGASLSTAIRTLRELPFYNTLFPLALGAFVGTAGALTTWARTRHTPNTAVSRRLARTFQNIRLFKQLTVIENVLVGMHRTTVTEPISVLLRLPIHKRREAALLAKARELLEFVGLKELEAVPAHSLPYGHQRRLEIARALASEPQLLLLDEPAAGMNPAEIGDLMDLISRIRDRGVTVLLIEHHMKLVMGISDHISVLDHGEKIADGTPEEVRANPAVVAAYLGEATDGH